VNLRELRVSLQRAVEEHRSLRQDGRGREHRERECRRSDPARHAHVGRVEVAAADPDARRSAPDAAPRHRHPDDQRRPRQQPVPERRRGAGHQAALAEPHPGRTYSDPIGERMVGHQEHPKHHTGELRREQREGTGGRPAETLAGDQTASRRLLEVGESTFGSDVEVVGTERHIPTNGCEVARDRHGRSVPSPTPAAGRIGDIQHR
jgi:hypothetical protein